MYEKLKNLIKYEPLLEKIMLHIKQGDLLSNSLLRRKHNMTLEMAGKIMEIIENE